MSVLSRRRTDGAARLGGARQLAGDAKRTSTSSSDSRSQETAAFPAQERYSWLLITLETEIAEWLS